MAGADAPFGGGAGELREREADAGEDAGVEEVAAGGAVAQPGAAVAGNTELKHGDDLPLELQSRGLIPEPLPANPRSALLYPLKRWRVGGGWPLLPGEPVCNDSMKWSTKRGLAGGEQW